jgi:hypothetical protein
LGKPLPVLGKALLSNCEKNGFPHQFFYVEGQDDGLSSKKKGRIFFTELSYDGPNIRIFVKYFITFCHFFIFIKISLNQ